MLAEVGGGGGAIFLDESGDTFFGGAISFCGDGDFRIEWEKLPSAGEKFVGRFVVRASESVFEIGWVEGRFVVMLHEVGGGGLERGREFERVVLVGDEVFADTVFIFGQPSEDGGKGLRDGEERAEFFLQSDEGEAGFVGFFEVKIADECARSLGQFFPIRAVSDFVVEEKADSAFREFFEGRGNLCSGEG